jgi:hypothetical protein
MSLVIPGYALLLLPLHATTTTWTFEKFAVRGVIDGRNAVVALLSSQSGTCDGAVRLFVLFDVVGERCQSRHQIYVIAAKAYRAKSTSKTVRRDEVSSWQELPEHGEQ